MERKDYFSGHSSLYATFRPTYPSTLYDFIFSHLKNKSVAWDCATGNGQVAKYLALTFDQVFATDISQNQLNNATQQNNIVYSLSPAEKTNFKDHQFDLITVGQAMHWFKLDEFYKEVKRVGKKDSLLASWGYALCKINPAIDKLFLHFYHDVVGPYWDDARKLVEDEYRSISFPFKQIPSPEFQLDVEWTFDEFVGYLSTWSATQKYIKSNGNDPLLQFAEQLKLVWKPEEKYKVTFPLFLKLGQI
jgi:hypothetical protein